MNDSRFRGGSILPVFVAFLASGASSLIAEVTWNRMLIVVVGNSMSATAMILVVFMGGLGFGSYVGGRIFARRSPSLLPYVLLEAVIGGFILASPALFGWLSSAFSSLAEVISNGALLTAVRVFVSLVALFVPASLMGATFPAIVSGAVHDSPDGRTARTGYLYAVNTLGAAIGCFAAGFHLLFEFGVQFTLMCAFGLNVLAALAALAAVALGPRRQAAVPTEPPAVEEGAAVAPASSAPRRFLAVATFGTGFVALAYEVILTRIGILYLGNVSSVFALVLTGFLLGTALSAILGT
jgi:spermidine synthase